MSLGDWLDRRTGWRALAASARADLARPIPRHVNALFALGTLAATFLAVQVATGILLLLHYRPAAGAAHESLEVLLSEVPSGWFVRSLHAWGAHLFVATLALHMARVFVYGGYKRPRELTWVLGVLLLVLGLAFAFTGSVLPWDQRAYWATTVATDMTDAAPVLGGEILRLVRGGETVGEPTLGRMFALHVALLPLALLPVLAAHLWLVRRLGISTLEDVSTEERVGHASLCEGGEPFFPHHVLREAFVVNLALALLFLLAILAPAGLGPKADPLETPPGVKPEWYFLPVYQLQKYMPATVLGVEGRTLGFLLANLPPLLLLALPFLDRAPARRPSRRKGAMALALLAAFLAFALGILGFLSDRRVRILGRTYAFDVKGFPERSAEAR
ncbi:MAG TPA: cytochrome bc complex cytochrome b subunit [Planctomycetota bacterium]|nr:cytochrome bc complex cytochrome b subunit [Planctomycetota bacterium]